MKRVMKWPIPILDNFTLELPIYSQILTVQMQGDTACIWTLAEDTNKLEERAFRLAGTEHLIVEDWWQYVGTFQMHNGSLVFHLFVFRSWEGPPWEGFQ